MIKMKIKKIAVSIVLMLMAVCIMSGCGRQKATTATSSSSSTSKNSSSSSEPTLSVEVGHGQYEQSAGLVSVPVVLVNNGSNKTVIDSNNFTLKLGDSKYHLYQNSNEASDFHLNFGNDNVYQNTLTFDVKRTLTKSQLDKLELTYLTDKGTTVKAKKIPRTVSQDKIRENVSGYTPTDLGTYYKKCEDYLKETNKEKKADPKATITSIEDEFSDKDYDKLRAWVVIPSTTSQGSNNAVIKVYNATKTDFDIAYGDMELVDHAGNEIQVAPSYRNYVVNFPHGKFVTVVVPMEAKLKPSNAPYTFQVRADSDGENPSGNFFDTKKSFNPVEVKVSNNVTSSTLFSLTPADYPKDSIPWSDVKANADKNTITANVELSDYFNLQNTNYQVLAENDSGSRIIKGVQKVTPRYVATTGKQKITWHIKGLSNLMSYQHVYLMNNGKKIFQIK